MSFLGRIVLALLALGMQLPAQLIVPLCLCELLPFTCAQGGACGLAGEAAPGCCGKERAPESQSDAPACSAHEISGCCGCEVRLGGTGPARKLADAGCGALTLHWVSSVSVALAPLRFVPAVLTAAQPPRSSGAARHRPLRI